MVSLQASLSQEDQRKVVSPNFETNSKKRKWHEPADQHQIQVQQSKRSHAQQADDIELNLDAPLPLEWQRCLDIKSGQIHFYNTWTHRRTSRDPRSAPEPRPPSLDLELNLNSSSNRVEQVQAKRDDHRLSHVDHQHKSKSSSSCSSSSSSSSSSPSRSPSWIALDVDRQEMVAAVCMRCHMLVMMCKATPSCPNCKFVHPQGQSSSSSSSLISNNKPAGFRLLCCKD